MRIFQRLSGSDDDSAPKTKVKPKKRGDQPIFSDETLKANGAGKLTHEQTQRLARRYLLELILLFIASAILLGSFLLLFLRIMQSASGILQTFEVYTLILPLVLGWLWLLEKAVENMLKRGWCWVRLHQDKLTVRTVTGRIIRHKECAVIGTEYLYLTLIDDAAQEYVLKAQNDYHVYFMQEGNLLLSAEPVPEPLDADTSWQRFIQQRQAYLNKVLGIRNADILRNREGQLTQAQRGYSYLWRLDILSIVVWFMLWGLIWGIFTALFAPQPEWLTRDSPLETVFCLVPSICISLVFVLRFASDWWLYFLDMRDGKVIAFDGEVGHKTVEPEGRYDTVTHYNIRVGGSGLIDTYSDAAQAAFYRGISHVIYVLPHTKKIVGAEVIPPENLTNHT